MVVVSQTLIDKHLEKNRLDRLFTLLSSDEVVRSLLKMANVMAVSRLKYNDHGHVHSKIVSGSALEILSLLERGGIEPSLVKDGVGSFEDAQLVVLAGAYLHDLGNAVHRSGHHIHGCYLAEKVLDRVIPRVCRSEGEVELMKAEILHCIYSHDEEVECLSIEAGAVKVADGTDMAEGRARVPYRTGKVDIHSLSALSIRRVELKEGSRTPVGIRVHMDNPAGVFQVEVVLGRKIRTSRIGDYVEVEVLADGKLLKTIEPPYPF